MQNPVSHNLQKAETQTPFRKNETPKGFRETAFRQILSAFRFSVFSVEDFLSRIVCGQNEKRRHTFLFESYVSLNPYGLTKF